MRIIRHAMVALILVVGLTACGGSGEAAAPDPDSSSSTESSPGPGDTTPEGGEVVETSFGDVEIVVDVKDGQGFRRTYAVVPEVTDADLETLIGELHAAEPDAWWWLMDSADRNEVLATTIPKTLKGDYDGFPASWMVHHAVGAPGARDRRWDPDLGLLQRRRHRAPGR